MRFKIGNIFKLLFGLGLLLLLNLPGIKGKGRIDSLEAILADYHKEDRKKVNLLNTLSFNYRVSNLEKMEKLGLKALKLSRELEFPNGKSRAYRNLSIAHWFQGNYQKAHQYLDKSIEIQRSRNDFRGLAGNIMNRGSIWRTKGNLKKAVDQYFNALKKCDQHGYDTLKGKVLNNIGTIYFDQRKWDKALKYYRQSAKIKKNLHNKAGLASSYNNLGNVYDKTGDLDKAMDYYQQSLKIKKEIGDKRGIANTLNNLGNIQLDLKHYDTALTYFKRSIRHKRRIGDHQGIAATYKNMGDAFLRKGIADSASYFLRKANEMANALGIKKLALASYKDLVKADSIRGDYKKALTWQQQYTNLKDSFINAEKRKKIAAIEAKYQTAKKEAKLQEAERQNYMLAAGLLLVIVIALSIIAYYRYRQHSEKLKAQKNEALAHKRQLERDYYKKHQELTAIVQGQEMERKRLGEELHDGIGSRLAGLRLNLNQQMANSKQTNNNEKGLDKLAAEIDFICQELRTISHDLMPPALLQNSLTKAIKDFIKETHYQHPSLEISCELYPEDLINDTTEDFQVSIYRIVQELVNNVIKHAKATTAYLQVIVHEDHVNLIMEDNGKGFDPNNQHEGVGLHNIRTRVQMLDGDLKIESGFDQGTMFKIDVKYVNETAVVH
jgi:signal transduction histidine kinase